MPNTSIQINKAIMSDEMQRDALQCALLAVNIEILILCLSLQEFDRKHQASWQCIVGNFGCLVTYTDNCYIHFKVGNRNILLFKAP
uniref:Dynein light chain n=1 Tax=Cyprinus carpio TaxID=7962 RepID=A0A8C2KMC2_CYPCA